MFWDYISKVFSLCRLSYVPNKLNNFGDFDAQLVRNVLTIVASILTISLDV